MTVLSIARLHLLRKYWDDPQLEALREGVGLLAQALTELEMRQQVGRNATNARPSAKPTATATGSGSERCRLTPVRNPLSQVPKQAQAMVAALVRTIFVQPDAALAREQLEKVAESLRQRFPKAAERLLEAAEDVLTYMAFPPEHWRQIDSTNPLERLK